MTGMLSTMTVFTHARLFCQRSCGGVTPVCFDPTVVSEFESHP